VAETITHWAAQVRAGDTRAISRAITAIENAEPRAEDLLRELFPATGRAYVMGVTGAPGTGKSTLVDRLAAHYRARGKTVGIIAVDPTSPYTGGAVLGDRIRMQEHHADPGVFIRSMATRGWLGGLARATTEMTMLLDAAGRDVVLVETVGVGQDEVEIARLAHVTLVVLTPGAGDDVQTLKAGIMEIAQVFVINKSDLPGADKLQREMQAAMSLAPVPETSPDVEIVHTVALEGTGVADVLAAARRAEPRGRDPERSAEIWAARLREMLRERLLDGFSAQDFLTAGREVAAHQRDPYSIINAWLQH
jgi:LAO/AO transport system kinase